MTFAPDAIPGVLREIVAVSDTTKRRAQVIRCRQTGCANSMPVICTGQVWLPPEPLMKAFRNAGWRVDKRGNHACPTCIAKEKKAVTDTPRKMELRDRRKINAKLFEVYDDVNSRYCDNTTDHSVSQELNVPRAWVEQLREENFGPAGRNVEMDRIAAEIGQMQADVKKFTDDCMVLAAAGEKLQTRVNEFRKRLEAAEAAVGPRLRAV